MKLSPRRGVSFAAAEQPPVPEAASKNNGWEKQPWYKQIRKRRLFHALILSMFAVPAAACVLPNPALSKAEKAAFIQSDSPNAEKFWESEAQSRRSRCIIERGLLVVAWELAAMMLQVGIVLKTQLSFDKKRAAYHELGHLLAIVGANSNFYPYEVTVQSQGHFGGYVAYNTKSGVQPSDPYVPESYWDELRLICHAGEAMEQLVGVDLFGEENDRKAIWQVMKKKFCQHPEQWRSLLADYWKIGKETRNYLMQFDRKTVDALAERLVQDITWDRQKIRQIVDEFGLDKVGTPAAEKPASDGTPAS